MEVEEDVNPELQAIFDEFRRIRDAYVALSAYCNAQEETLAVEKERSERLKGNLEKLSGSNILVEKQYKSTIEKLRKEKEDLCKTVEELKEQCDHLRLVNIERNGNDGQIHKLQDELEVLKVQLLMQEEKHYEDIALLKQKHSDEIQKYKMLLGNAKQRTTTVKNTKRGRDNNASHSNEDSCFRWPKLNIEKINTTSIDILEENQNGNRVNQKRKLFHEDGDVTVDIV